MPLRTRLTFVLHPSEDYIGVMAEWGISRNLLDHLERAQSVAVLTGAGVSAESGVPTFRGAGGLWREFHVEELATPEAFARHPKIVWEWYMWRRDTIQKVAPNSGHFALAEWERLFPLFTLITQNVDGLHSRAGSQRVIELHGNIMRSRCQDCHLEAGDSALDEDGQLPACSCGGLVRPDVVWFGELLPPSALQASEDAVKQAEVFLAIGTSSLVYPAAGLTQLAKRHGAYTVEINPETTELSHTFDEVLRGRSGEILPAFSRAWSLAGPSVAIP